MPCGQRRMWMVFADLNAEVADKRSSARDSAWITSARSHCVHNRIFSMPPQQQTSADAQWQAAEPIRISLLSSGVALVVLGCCVSLRLRAPPMTAHVVVCVAAA